MLIDLLHDDMKLHEYFSIEGAKTPYALAKFLGITPANVYDWLKNGRPIPINHCASGFFSLFPLAFRKFP